MDAGVGMGMGVEGGMHPATTANKANATTHVNPRTGEDLTTDRCASSAAMECLGDRNLDDPQAHGRHEKGRECVPYHVEGVLETAWAVAGLAPARAEDSVELCLCQKLRDRLAELLGVLIVHLVGAGLDDVQL